MTIEELKEIEEQIAAAKEQQMRDCWAELLRFLEPSFSTIMITRKPDGSVTFAWANRLGLPEHMVDGESVPDAIAQFAQAQSNNRAAAAAEARANEN